MDQASLKQHLPRNLQINTVNHVIYWSEWPMMLLLPIIIFSNIGSHLVSICWNIFLLACNNRSKKIYKRSWTCVWSQHAQSVRNHKFHTSQEVILSSPLNHRVRQTKISQQIRNKTEQQQKLTTSFCRMQDLKCTGSKLLVKWIYLVNLQH